MVTYELHLFDSETGKLVDKNVEILLFALSVSNTLQRFSGDGELQITNFMSFALSKIMPKNLPALGIPKKEGLAIIKELSNNYRQLSLNIATLSELKKNKSNVSEFVDSVVDMAYLLCDSIKVKSSFANTNHLDEQAKKLAFRTLIEIKHNKDTWLINTVDGQAPNFLDFSINGLKNPILDKNSSQILTLFRFIAIAVSNEEYKQIQINKLSQHKEISSLAKRISNELGGDYREYLIPTKQFIELASNNESHLVSSIAKSYSCGHEEALLIVDILKPPYFFEAV